jgi:hypothetical protein
MGTFQIKFNEADMRTVRSMLSGIPQAIALVTMRAINKTLTGVRTDASAAVRAEITAKKAAIDATFKITPASAVNLSGRIASTGRPLALIDYAARQTKKGVSVQVLKARPRKIIPRTFVATMRVRQLPESGHEGVYWRVWHTSGAAAKKPRLQYAALPKQYRLPIKERFGPRIPDIMSNEPVMKTILAKTDERLHGNMMHELNYELE